MMSLARAIEIVGAINDRAAFTLGMTETVRSLEGVSLAEMLEAKVLVEAEDEKHVIPDDRLIAAAYCAEHYDVSAGSIILVPCSSDETDRKLVEHKALVMMEISRGKAR